MKRPSRQGIIQKTLMKKSTAAVGQAKQKKSERKISLQASFLFTFVMVKEFAFVDLFF